MQRLDAHVIPPSALGRQLPYMSMHSGIHAEEHAAAALRVVLLLHCVRLLLCWGLKCSLLAAVH
jgi:hypothetical protein